MRNGDSRLAGFNWAAAFFPAYWLLYRRFWIGGVALAIANLLVGLLTQVVALLGAPSAGSLISLGFAAVQFLEGGLLANLLLYSRAKGVLTSGSERELARLRGTSETAAWVGVVVFSVLPALSRFVAAIDPSS